MLSKKDFSYEERAAAIDHELSKAFRELREILHQAAVDCLALQEKFDKRKKLLSTDNLQKISI